jgi:uncharacterized protein (DUF2236 family)
MTTSPETARSMPLPATRPDDSAMPTRLAEPGGALWEGAGLVTFSFSNGGAFLLQVMEPSIAAVVDQHSVFRTDPVGRGLRSLASVMMWVYSDEESLQEVERLRTLHAPLESVDADGVRHTALSSGPWAWVLLTGMHAFTEAVRVFGESATRDEVEQVYDEMKQLMRGFKVAEKEIPATYDDFCAHFDKVVTGHLQNTKVAHDFIEGSRRPGPPLQLPAFLHPVWRIAVAPLGHFQYLAILGMIPPSARATLGVRWGRWQDFQLRAFGRVVGKVVPLLPERIRYFPIAYEARKLDRIRTERPGDTRAIAQAERKLRKAIDKRPV